MTSGCNVMVCIPLGIEGVQVRYPNVRDSETKEQLQSESGCF